MTPMTKYRRRQSTRNRAGIARRKENNYFARHGLNG